MIMSIVTDLYIKAWEEDSTELYPTLVWDNITTLKLQLQLQHCLKQGYHLKRKLN